MEGPHSAEFNPLRPTPLGSKNCREEELEESGIALIGELKTPPRKSLRVWSDRPHLVGPGGIVLAPIPAVAQFALKDAGSKLDAGEAVAIQSYGICTGGA